MLDIEALKAIVRPIISDKIQRFPIIMQAYIGTYMKKTTFNFDTMKTEEGFRNPNTGEGTLRIFKGNLFRSFSRNNDNNIFKVQQSGDNFEVEYGSKVPYALIHEYGGTINHPGGQPYKIIGNGKAVFVKKTDPEAKDLKKTKPHSITMPARPYFNPAVKKFESENKWNDEVRDALIKGIQQWQENQRRSNQ